jgi:hypothetical protein
MPKKTCFTGGAKGSDYVWGRFAEKHGWTPQVLSFQGHNLHPNTVGEVLCLPPKYLTVADAYLERANRVLQRRFPTNSDYVDNLLRRNYYQVVESNQVCGIGTISDDLKKVNGGTGWAVQMGIDLTLPVYVFDQSKKHWVTWNTWLEIFDPCDPPLLEDKFTGIGTREISKDGIIAIKEVFEKTNEVRGKDSGDVPPSEEPLLDEV